MELLENPVLSSDWEPHSGPVLSWVVFRCFSICSLIVTTAVALLSAFGESSVSPGLIPFVTPSLVSTASPGAGRRGLMNTGTGLELPTPPAGLCQNIKLPPGCSSTLL